MTIKKKTMVLKKPAAAAATAPGGAAINSRFKLDQPDAATLAASAAEHKLAAVAFAFALVALAVVGTLTFVLWKHWEFLMPA